MTLTLSIRNFDRLDNGMPTELVLHRRGALIGRSNTCDWSLPDPRSHISSRHCEISFADGFYFLTDISTNGTFLNGGPERMRDPRQIAHGDQFTIGQYEIAVSLSGEAQSAIERAAQEHAQAQGSGWGGWDHAGGTTPPAAAPDPGGWGTPPSGGEFPAPAQSGWGPPGGGVTPPPPPSIPPAPVGAGWTPSARAPDIAAASVWEQAAPPTQGASGWSSAAPDRPPPPSPDDVWGKLAEGNVVDWARGGFGQPVANNPDPLGLARDPRQSLGTPSAASPSSGGWGAPTASHPAPPPAYPAAPPVAAPTTPTVPPPAPGGNGVERFAQAAGLSPGKLNDLSPAAMDRAGQLFRRLVAGLVVMVEARARAKSQMGAEATSFSIDGNNPIKFARTPEEAIAALLNPPERGFMEADRAIDDSFFDLQSHQMATLKAMQGALRATLDRFSPTAISRRAEAKGLLAKIIPGARNAALWQAYEREFSGVAQGSDEAFMDVFAKEFRKAYEDQANRERQQRR